MAALADPITTVVDWIKTSVLPEKARLEALDINTVSEMEQNGTVRKDGEFGWIITAMEPSLNDLNTNRMAARMDLVGIWTVSKDARQAYRIAVVVANIARKLEITAIPDGVDRVEIVEQVDYRDGFGLTVVTFPLRVQFHMQEA